jgi:peroxiredoxin
MVKVGDKAPEITLLDQDGNEWSLAGSLGEHKAWHLIYFYP